MYKLNDSWSVTGTDYDEFKDVVKEIDEATHYEIVNGAFVDFYFNLDGPFKQNNEEAYRIQRFRYPNLRDNLTALEQGVYVHTNWLTANPSNLMETKLLRPYSEKQARLLDAELLKESFKNAGFIMRIGTPVALDSEESYEIRNPNLYYLADTAKTLLCSRMEIKGNTAQENTLYLTYLICDTMGHLSEGPKPQHLKMMYREVKDPTGNLKPRRKIFGFFSSSYVPIRQGVLPETVDAIVGEHIMGKTEVKAWQVDQNFTKIYLEFPEAADDFQKMYGLSDRVIPGMLLCSSDTGSSSVIIRGTYRVEGSKNGHYVVCDEYAHRHIGNITSEIVLEEANEQILKKLRRLPEALAAKMAVRIGNADLSTARGVAQNRQIVGDTIKRAYKKLGLHKILGKKRSDELIPQMQEDISPNSVYTEYDIAMMFLTLSERLPSLSDSLRSDVAKACGNAPFIDYPHKAAGGSKNKEDDDETNLILLPQAM